MTHITCGDLYRAPDPTGETCLLVVDAPLARLLGESFQLPSGDLVLGRDAGCDVVLDVLDVSRRHARIRKVAGLAVLEDLGSKNGTLLDERCLKAAAALEPGARIRLGSVVLKYLRVNDLESLCCARMKRLANEDALTGLALRRAFADGLARELARSRRHGHPLCLMLVDIDRFKTVNDRFGHLVGDAVLRQLASCISRLVRREQLLARVGGDELALLLPDVPMEKAGAFAERIRRVVEAAPFGTDSCRIGVTVSIGIAAFDPSDLQPDTLFARADAGLYAAKCGGRNRVCVLRANAPGADAQRPDGAMAEAACERPRIPGAGNESEGPTR
jgi:diguanylate cyclase (GGDEF)-like protein